MIRHFFLLSCFLLAALNNMSSQKPVQIIGDKELLSELRTGLEYIYNCDLENALNVYESVKQQRPNHPVTTFFYGLAYYWGKYDQILEKDNNIEFVKAMEETIERAHLLWADDEDNIEGVFFDLVARAMLMMYYSDKGHSGKVIKIAPTAYRHVQKSFELKEVFREFYFITGLYLPDRDLDYDNFFVDSLV